MSWTESDKGSSRKIGDRYDVHSGSTGKRGWFKLFSGQYSSAKGDAGAMIFGMRIFVSFWTMFGTKSRVGLKVVSYCEMLWLKPSMSNWAMGLSEPKVCSKLGKPRLSYSEINLRRKALKMSKKHKMVEQLTKNMSWRCFDELLLAIIARSLTLPSEIMFLCKEKISYFQNHFFTVTHLCTEEECRNWAIH